MRDITPVSCTTDGITGQRVIASPKWSRLCLGGSLGIRDDSDGGSCSADVKQSSSTNWSYAKLAASKNARSPPSRNGPRVYGCAKSRVSSPSRVKWDEQI